MITYISHSNADKEFVTRLAKDLRTKEGIDAWLDKWEINPGDKIPEKIEKAISEAEVFILVLSPYSVNSPWVDYERQAWLSKQIEEEKVARAESRVPKLRLIPVIYKNCEIPSFILPLKYIKFNEDDYEKSFRELVNTVNEISDKPTLKNEQFIKTTSFPKKSSEINSKLEVPNKLLALRLLKSLSPSQFEEIVFVYDMPQYLIVQNSSQVEKSIQLIKYAQQKEGEYCSQLITILFTVIPHLR